MKVRCINTTRLPGTGVVPGLQLDGKYYVALKKTDPITKELFYDVGLRTGGMLSVIFWVPAVRFVDELSIPDFGMSKKLLIKLHKKMVRYYATINRYENGKMLHLWYVDSIIKTRIAALDNAPKLLIHHKINLNSINHATLENTL